MSDQTPPPDDQVHAKRLAEKRFVGSAVMAVGAVIALLCGLCTLWFGGSFFVAWLQTPSLGGQFLGVLLLPLLFGGLPTAAGVVLFWTGRRIYREGRKRGGEPWRTPE